MTQPTVFYCLLLVGALGADACAGLPGKPAAGPDVPRPDSILDPVALYGSNCAACHRADGKHGPALALSDPVYLAIVDDSTFRSTIAEGRPGTAMSAFSRKARGM